MFQNSFTAQFLTFVSVFVLQDVYQLGINYNNDTIRMVLNKLEESKSNNYNSIHYLFDV